MRYLVFILMATTLLFSCRAKAQICLDYSSYFHNSVGLKVPAPTYSAAAKDHYLFVAADSGLFVYDISDPQNYIIVSSLTGVSNPVDIEIRGDYAFVLGSDLYAVDISNPISPQLVSQAGAGDSWDIEICGDHAYVAIGEGGARIIDISAPDSIYVVASVSLSDGLIRDLDVENDMLCVVVKRSPYFGPSQMRRYDVTDPASPVPAGSVSIDDLWSIDVDGQYAYVGTDDDVYIVDISPLPPASPYILSNFAVSGGSPILDVKYINGSLLMTDEHFGIKLLSVADPLNAYILGSIYLDTTPHKIHIYADTAFIGSTTYDLGSGFVDLIDISNLALIPVLGQVNGAFLDIATSGNNVYVVGSYEDFKIIDITDPEMPFVTGEHWLPNYARGVGAKGEYAFVSVANNPNFYVFDCSSPTNPDIAYSGYLDVSYSYNVEVYGDYAFLPTWGQGTFMIDISNPFSPVAVSNILHPANAVVVVDGIAYIAHREQGIGTYNGLGIYDISDIAAPQLLGVINTDDMVWDIAVKDSIALLAARYLGIVAVDVSIPSSPMPLDTLHTESEYMGIDIAGNLGYVADWENGIHVIDVSEPYELRVVSTIETEDKAFRVQITDNGVCALQESISNMTLIFRDCNEPRTDIIVTDVPNDEGGFLEVWWPAFPIMPAGGEVIVRYEVQRYEDDWIIVSHVPVTGSDEYTAIVETNDIYIIGEAAPFSDYRVVAYSDAGKAYFSSNIASAYSIDNLPPSAPVLSIWDNEVQRILFWQNPDIPDFKETCIYRGTEPCFEQGDPLVCTTGEVYVEEDLSLYYYVAKFKDIHGNLSEASNEVTGEYPTDAPVAAAYTLTLYQNHPNPFNPQTTFNFYLPQREHVQFEIYDVRGRQVAELIDEVMEQGWYTESWNGRDDSGIEVASGIYFAMLKTPSNFRKKKIVLAR